MKASDRLGSFARFEPKLSVLNWPESIHRIFRVFDNTIPIIDYYLCVDFDPMPEKIQIARFKPAPYNPYRWANSDSDHFRRSDPRSAGDFHPHIVPPSPPLGNEHHEGQPGPVRRQIRHLEPGLA